MDCNRTECEWNACNCCCPESEEMMNAAIPNTTECPSYFDLQTAAENERKEMIELCRKVLVECGSQNTNKIIGELKQMRGMDFIKYSDRIFELRELKLRSDTLDEMLEEINEIGVEEYKKKYNLGEYADA